MAPNTAFPMKHTANVKVRVFLGNEQLTYSSVLLGVECDLEVRSSETEEGNQTM